MESPVDSLLNSPRLAQHVERLQDVLAEERARRERFYEEIDEHQKAEFINGEIVMATPARLKHNRIRNRLHHLLHLHVQNHDLGLVGGEKMLIALTRNDYEPDVCFFEQETAQAFDPEQWKFPAPAFVCEVLSPNTEERDRGVKFEDYAAHGVREYWLLDPGTETAEQYVLENETYILRMKAQTGQLESAVVEGFTVPVQALFDDDANREAVRDLLAPS